MPFNTTELYQIRDKVARYGEPMKPLTPLGSLELIDQLLRTMKERDEIAAVVDNLKNSDKSHAVLLEDVRRALGCKVGEGTVDTAEKIAAESTGLYAHKLRVRKALGIDAGYGCVKAIKELKERAESSEPRYEYGEERINAQAAARAAHDAAAVLGAKSNYLIHRCHEVMDELKEAKAEALFYKTQAEAGAKLLKADTEALSTGFSMQLAQVVWDGIPDRKRGLTGNKLWHSLLETLAQDHCRLQDLLMKLKALEEDSITPIQFACKAFNRTPPSLVAFASYESQWDGLANHIRLAFDTALKNQEALKEAESAIDSLSKRVEFESASLDEERDLNACVNKELSTAKRMLIDQERFYAIFARNMFENLSVATCAVEALKKDNRRLQEQSTVYVREPVFGGRASVKPYDIASAEYWNKTYGAIHGVVPVK